MASVLPAISIIALYFIHNMLARLVAIMAFSALFSFTLAIFTTAKRIEIFAATAAYVLTISLLFILGSQRIGRGHSADEPSSFASVQVVFVGSTNGGLG